MGIAAVFVAGTGGGNITVVNSGVINMQAQLVGGASEYTNTGINMTVVGPGILELSVAFDNTGDLDTILDDTILDEAGDPILDVQSQYILGSPS